MAEAETKTETGWVGRLQQAVARAREHFATRLDELLRGTKTITPAQLDELEALLLAADVGVETSGEILAHLQQQLKQNRLPDAAALRAALHEELTVILRAAQQTVTAAESSTEKAHPEVIFFVGVNGTGKTTSLAKLAYRRQLQGQRVLLCAADTFRAAASEQLEIWAKRLGCQILRQQPGADPAAVVYDAIKAAKARALDAVLVDTAGRLHTKSNLMAELDKMKRSAQKLVVGAPQEILLVLDATTGQNALAQARQFTARIGVTGILLAKLDGTAKGGIILAIARELGLPIRYVGTGEQLDDLVGFDPEVFVESLLAAPNENALRK